MWTQLGSKYDRPLEDDDIVDLANEIIVKDRGVLSSSENMPIGFFADKHEEQLVQDEPDELDAFAEPNSDTDGNEVDGIELKGHSWHLPPVHESDPEDAADLAEFLEAERLRKERFGDHEESAEESDEDEDVVDLGALEYGDEYVSDNNAGASVVSRTNADLESVDESWEECEPFNDEDMSNRKSTSRRSLSFPSGSPEIDSEYVGSEPRDNDSEVASDSADDLTMGINNVTGNDASSDVSDTESEDELGDWQNDESNALYMLSSGDEDEPPAVEGRTSTLTPTPEPIPKVSKRGSNIGSNTSNKITRRIQDSEEHFQPELISPLKLPPSFGPEMHNSKPTLTYSRRRRGSSSPNKSVHTIDSTDTQDYYIGETTVPSSMDSKHMPSRSEQSQKPMRQTKVKDASKVSAEPSSKKMEKLSTARKPSQGGSTLYQESNCVNRKGKAKTIDPEPQHTEYSCSASESPALVPHDLRKDSRSKLPASSRKRRRASSMSVEYEFTEADSQQHSARVSPSRSGLALSPDSVIRESDDGYCKLIISISILYLL